MRRERADLFETIWGADSMGIATAAWDAMNQSLYERSYRVLVENVCPNCQYGEHCQDLCFWFVENHFSLQRLLWDEIARSC